MATLDEDPIMSDTNEGRGEEKVEEGQASETGNSSDGSEEEEEDEESGEGDSDSDETDSDESSSSEDSGFYKEIEEAMSNRGSIATSKSSISLRSSSFGSLTDILATTNDLQNDHQSEEKDEGSHLPPGWEETNVCNIPLYVNKEIGIATYFEPEFGVQYEKPECPIKLITPPKPGGDDGGGPSGLTLAMPIMPPSMPPPPTQTEDPTLTETKTEDNNNSKENELPEEEDPPPESKPDQRQSRRVEAMANAALFESKFMKDLRRQKKADADAGVVHMDVFDHARRPAPDEDSEGSLEYEGKEHYNRRRRRDSELSTESKNKMDSSIGASAKRLLRRARRRMGDASATGRRLSFTMMDASRQREIEMVDPNACNQSEEETKKEKAFALCLGTTLTFNMGFVNGACFSGFLVEDVREPVAGYTTPYTDWALRLADGTYDRVLFQSIMIACFVGGSFLSGVVTPNAKPYRIEPTYGPSFVAAGICLLISTAFAASGWNENVVFYMAAAAGGIQNGISSAYTAKLIRSTGLTGSSTDIGLYFGQYVRGNDENREKLIVLCILTVAFTTGGFPAFYVTQIFGSYTLLVSAALFLTIGLSIMIFLVKKLKISFKAAIFGTWKWKAGEEMKEALSILLDMDKSQLANMGEDNMDAMFDRIDTDGSGTINAEELYVLLRSTGAKITQDGAKQLLDYADVDNNGCIDRDEWKILVGTALAERRSVMGTAAAGVAAGADAAMSGAKAAGGMAKDLMDASARNIITAVNSTNKSLRQSTKSISRSLSPKRKKGEGVVNGQRDFDGSSFGSFFDVISDDDEDEDDES